MSAVSSSRTSVHRPETPPRASDAGRSRLGDLTRPIGIDRRITRKRRSNLFLGLVALVIAGAIAAALVPACRCRRTSGRTKSLAQRQEQLDQLDAVNSDLQREVDRLGTDDGIREAAREEIGYVDAGEVRQSVLEFPDLPTDLPDGWPYDLVTAIIAVRTAATP